MSFLANNIKKNAVVFASGVGLNADWSVPDLWAGEVCCYFVHSGHSDTCIFHSDRKLLSESEMWNKARKGREGGSETPATAGSHLLKVRNAFNSCQCLALGLSEFVQLNLEMQCLGFFFFFFCSLGAKDACVCVLRVDFTECCVIHMLWFVGWLTANIIYRCYFTVPIGPADWFKCCLLAELISLPSSTNFLFFITFPAA